MQNSYISESKYTKNPLFFMQASQIAHLIRDYTHIIVEKQKKAAHHVRRPGGGAPTATAKGGGATGAARRGRGSAM